MSYQVTISLNSAYTGTTQADNFTIVAKHANGTPSDDTLATGVTKTQLTAGVTYTVADTVTGGTVTSTGVCTNSVTWLGLNGSVPGPTPTPTATVGDPETLYRFSYCGGHFQDNPSAGTNVAFYASTLVSAGMTTVEPIAGDTIVLSGSGNAGAVWEYNAPGGIEEYAFATIIDFNGSLCPGPQV